MYAKHQGAIPLLIQAFRSKLPTLFYFLIKMLTLCYRKFGITISNDIAPILPKKELLYFDYALIREPPLSNEHKIK